jgi:hypothetical protein
LGKKKKSKSKPSTEAAPSQESKKKPRGKAPEAPPSSKESTPRLWQSLQSSLSGIPWEWIIGIATAILILVSRAPMLGLIIIDDSFITYTYSKNLVEHGQFVFNLGERVLATTTPLYALILSLFQWVGADLFYVAPVLNLILEGLVALFAFLIIRQIFVDRAYIIFMVFAVLFFLEPKGMMSSAGGMETSLYVLLTLVVVWTALDERWATTGIVAALLFMTRPDGLIIGTSVLAYYFVQKRAFPVRGVIAFIAALAPWLIFATFYYGSPIPSGVSAKLVLGADYATPVGKKFHNVYYMRQSFLVLSATLIGLAGMSWAVFMAIKNKQWNLLIYVVFFLLYNGAFMLTGTSVSWFWYFVPLYIPLYLYAGYLCAEFIGRFKPSGFIVAIWGIAFLSVVSFKFLPREYLRLSTKSISWDRGIRQPCLWIANKTPPETTVMCKTVGIPGFYANRRIIDPLGIISPELLPHYPGKATAEIEALRRTKPDYFISYYKKFYDQHEDMRRDYTLVREYEMPFALISHRTIWLYKKK